MPRKPGTFHHDYADTPRHGTYDQTRRSATARGYDAQWRRFRLVYLKRNPLCRHCKQRGEVRSATEVDHIEPLRDAPHRKYDEENLQGLCKTCHSIKTAAEGSVQLNP